MIKSQTDDEDLIKTGKKLPSRGLTLPWEYVRSTEYHGPYITSRVGNTIADFYTMSRPAERSLVNGGPSRPVHFMAEMADGHAEFAVRAVNNHNELLHVLKEAAGQFRYYAEQHLAKNPPDQIKAKTNADMAEMCEDAIRKAEESV